MLSYIKKYIQTCEYKHDRKVYNNPSTEINQDLMDHPNWRIRQIVSDADLINIIVVYDVVEDTTSLGVTNQAPDLMERLCKMDRHGDDGHFRDLTLSDEEEEALVALYGEDKTGSWEAAHDK